MGDGNTPDTYSAAWDDLRDPPVTSWDNRFPNEPSHLRSLDGASADPFRAEDVAEIMYHGNTGADDWDGNEAAVIRLRDGRLAAWETWWGPTGGGFSEDAYGGDADVWFSQPEHLRELIAQALTDHGREMCGIPREGLPDAAE